MMSNEEWDRKVEFLLNQQAQFDVDMRRLEAAQEETGKKLDRAAENISHLAGFIHEGFGLTMNMFKETNAQIKETDAQIRDTDAQIRDTDAQIRELKESQKLTDEALRKLITRVDRHLREDHPGLEY